MTVKNAFLSYNVASSSTLSGLHLLLNLFKPSIVFLQEITLTTDQLLAVVGSTFNGMSNVDPSDPRRPGNVVLWKSEMNDIVVQNVVPLRLQLLTSTSLGIFINV